MTFNLTVLEKKYSIFEYKQGSALPESIYSSEFWSITRTGEKLSVVTVQTDNVSDWVAVSEDWRIFRIDGPLDFSLVGVIADISAILKEARISVFIISTYDTDYILVKERDLNTSIASLRNKAYNIL